MAKLVPVVRVVPGFETGRIPWVSDPPLGEFPANYALKIEPFWDGCDGTPGTFNWNPVTIQIGFRWTGTSQALFKLLNRRLAARGWAWGAAPLWSLQSGSAWVSPRARGTPEVLSFDFPDENLPEGSNIGTIWLEAKPQGWLAGVVGC
jgi:hypothetical protein